jgi:hypothetical protein
MKRIFFLAVLGLAFVIVSATYVSAEPFISLHGKYSVVGSQRCVSTSTGGFDTTDVSIPLLAPATMRSQSIEGVLMFDGEGGGTFDVKSMHISHQSINPGMKPVNVWEGECNVAYEKSGPRTFMMNLVCTGLGTAGSGADKNCSTLSDGAIMSVTVLGGRSDLLITDLNPNIENLVNFCDHGTFYADRICTRTYTAIRRW